jgi:hypothetical protein
VIDWSTVFESAKPMKGATAAKVAEFVATLGLPLTPAEIERVNESLGNPYPTTDPHHATWQPSQSCNPASWVMPANRPVPPSYLSFVRYADGGDFQNGDRRFQMWGTGLREFLLCYNVPPYMPLAVPFAFSGGAMLMFDMRNPPDANGEYPIISAETGAMTFDLPHSPKVADSFLEVCLGRFDVKHFRDGVALTAERWLVWTDPKPMLEGCRGQPRKLRLFACACVRRVWHQLPSESRRAVELAERFADGEATDEERRMLEREYAAGHRFSPRTSAEVATLACLGATHARLGQNVVGNALSACETAAEAEASGGPAFHAARAKQADLVREIFGNPFDPVHIDPAWLLWNNRTVPQIAKRIYQERSFGDLPVLADALEEAGCTNAELLTHLREPRQHVRGCWALDLLRNEPS